MKHSKNILKPVWIGGSAKNNEFRILKKNEKRLKLIQNEYAKKKQTQWRNGPCTGV